MKQLKAFHYYLICKEYHHPSKERLFIIESLSKIYITNSWTTHEQFKVHIEGLQSNIPFIIVEIFLFYFYFLKVKVHMMEEFFYIIILNITCVTTLALGSRPRQGLTRLRTKRRSPGVKESVREWTFTFPKELPPWELESRWTLECLESNCRGQNPMD